jgi:thiol:disulfide interchange protein DsbD
VPSGRTLQVKLGSQVDAKLALELQAGYHVNSNKPMEDYLIPLRLTWNPGPLTPGDVIYPQPQLETYSFSKVPLSVFSGSFALVTRFTAPANAPLGPSTLTGKLRYQACDDRKCLAPKTLDVKLPVEIVK